VTDVAGSSCCLDALVADMKTFFSPEHSYRNPRTELNGGELVTPFESPERADLVLKALQDAALGPIEQVAARDLEVAKQVHDADYLQFLSRCWAEWVAAGHQGEIISYIWPGRRLTSNHVPNAIAGRVGYYSLSADTAIGEGTWQAAVSSQSVALAATEAIINGDRTAFGLCRPPGHHAARDQYGGYCFLNNAAIAAQQSLNLGRQKVAIVDIDFHHGNGTQDIFYHRDDVLVISLHGDPLEAFPHFSGYADEVGTDAGAGFNLNMPLPRGTNYTSWSACLDHALERVGQFGAELLVVSLGVDAFEQDPISFFKLSQQDFFDCGRRLGRQAIDTVFLLEGGYALDHIGENVTNVLSGFMESANLR